MSDYFRHARAVSQSFSGCARRRRSRSGRTSGDATTASASSTPPRGRSVPRPGCARFRPPSTSMRRRRRRADRDQRSWRAFAPRISSRPRPRATSAAFLKPRPGLYARLSEMHDCGLLGRMFPEFQAISCRVVRDFYHKYTVDEHTLLTIRNLERLATRRRPGRERFSGDARGAREAGAAGAVAAVPRRRQVARRGARDRKRPHGAPDARAPEAPGRRRARSWTS